jgi:hypothetical protein
VKASREDDCQDENKGANRQLGSTVNARTPSADADEDFEQLELKATVRVTSARRVASKSSSSNTAAEASGNKSFVPRDIKSKAKRAAPDGAPQNNIPPSSRHSRDLHNEGEGEGSVPWASAPRKFLDNASASRDSSEAPRSPTFSGSNPMRVSVSATRAVSRSSQAASNAQPATGWENRVEGTDSDEEGSAHTDESGDERRGGSDDEFDPHYSAQRSSGQPPARKTRKENYSLEALAGDLDRDPSIIQDGEFYEDFRARSLATSATGTAGGTPSRPNKSGRYEDPESASRPSPLTGGWTAPVVKKQPSTVWGAVTAKQDASTADSRHSFVVVAHERGLRTEHIQCTVVRNKRASINGKMQPTYQLILDETKKAIIVAQKMNMNRTSNYHLFDLTRPSLSTTLSKKSGNYLGKLRAKNVNRTEYVLLNQNSEREEIAGVRFDRITLMNQLKEGNQPRKMKVVIPPNNEQGVPIPNRTAETDAGSLAEKLTESEARASSRGANECYVFESKDPVLENGNFRLNFHGRVSKPSVKNFQMVAKDDIDNIVCQFGKVDEDVFHLDFKAPVTPVQAFAFALCQFNL